MFVKFHERLKNSEKGFTLIELLVVILIIAILAAIAIPVFLNQRKKGWKAQVESALKNMATAQESFLTANPAYATAVASLVAEGFTYATTEVTPTDPIAATAAISYCMVVTSAHDTTIVGRYRSSEGRPVVGTAASAVCP